MKVSITVNLENSIFWETLSWRCNKLAPQQQRFQDTKLQPFFFLFGCYVLIVVFEAGADATSIVSKNNLVPNQWQTAKVPHTLFYDSGDWASWRCGRKMNKSVFFNLIELESGQVSFGSLETLRSH